LQTPRGVVRLRVCELLRGLEPDGGVAGHHRFFPLRFERLPPCFLCRTVDAEKRVRSDAEQPRQGNDQRQVGTRRAGLPFADRLIGYAEPLRQPALCHSRLYAQGADVISDRYRHWAFLPFWLQV